MGGDEIILETERLIFRQTTIEDLDAYCDMEADPDVRRFVGGKPRSREEAEKRFLPSLQPATNGLHMWAAVLKRGNKYVGRCGIYPHFDGNGEPIPGEASFGVYLAKAWWGMGLATEAGRAFLKYGFEQLNLDRIVTMIQVGNDASVRVVEKIGFELMMIEKGEWRDFYHFAINRHRFDNFTNIVKSL
ncbi:GNAT family N-acetyltransferase [Mucilaginibacter gotjawali]|uniref:RimJ/RimL family protein N-acetyltransferase n=2 Tax=Mucilaginibacter gotjawali TaxID=1550579 RepID=A0A839S7Q6_9SPHI|nr:GNAT family N-acetyltransferase [Mucilaginibacter gotjawali]MBB3054151.1 RimJ/RimL family protein N-acetyltransferase [Mucilaginibacter gotjawali]BAU54422.1 putative ribosomal N-acetyltransferase YdaF [Mucilaginibacter gotjawali]